jgi:subtilisin family serine protease
MKTIVYIRILLFFYISFVTPYINAKAINSNTEHNDSNSFNHQTFNIEANSVNGSIVGTISINNEAFKAPAFKIKGDSGRSIFEINNKSGVIRLIDNNKLSQVPEPTLNIIVEVIENGIPDQTEKHTIEIRKITREERIKSIISESIYLESNVPSSFTKSYVFRFYGPSIDQDLTNFYSFFSKRRNYAKYLNPIIPRFDLVKKECINKQKSGCGTLSNVIHYYGLLAKSYPESFTSNVLDILKNIYDEDVIPGLISTPIEVKERIYIGYDEKIKTYYKNKSKLFELCKHYRFDGKDNCVTKANENYLSISAQGLKIKMELPEHNHSRIISQYVNEIKDTSGYKEERINFYYNTAIESNLLENPNKKLRTIQNTSVNELKKYIGLCQQQTDANKINEHLSNNSKLVKHVNNYKTKVLNEGLSIAPSDNPTFQYPVIILFDKFPHLDPKQLFNIDETIFFHPDLSYDLSQNIIKEHANFCLNDRQEKDGHGVFNLGLISARNNGIGVTGLLPEYDLSNMLINNVEYINDLVESIIFAENSYDSKKETVVANISLGTSNFDTRFLRSLRKSVRSGKGKVLYVIAAGPKHTNNAQEIQKIDCAYAPACLGSEPNVITVAALDIITSDSYPKFWEHSNYGSEIVSVASPGVDIVSTDIKISADGKVAKYKYSIGQGTSISTVFVSILAAKIISENPGITPEKIKRIILANVKELEIKDGSSGDFRRHLYSGTIRAGDDSISKVAAGRISEVIRPYNSMNEYIFFKDKNELKIGALTFGKTVNELIFFKSPAGGLSNEVKCSKNKIYRITRRDKNRFSVFCETDNSEAKFYDKVYLKPELNLPNSSSGMSCLYDKNIPCFWFKPANGDNAYEVDLEDIQHIYFGI